MTTERPRAADRPFNWRSVLRNLTCAGAVGLFSALMLPATFGDLADTLTRDVIGWPLLQLLGLYNCGQALVIAACGAAAVFEVIREFRAWWRQC